MAEIHAYKRPFCNTFTGCGRKRLEQELAELNDEALKRLTQQIIGEDRMRQLRQQLTANFAYDKK